MKYFLLFMIISASYLNAINFREGNKTSRYYIWFGGGIGTLGTENGGLFDINASLNYSRNNHIFQIRGLLAEELTVFGPRPNLEVWEAALLYGRRKDQGRISVSYLAGISYTGGIYRGDLLGSGMFSDYYEELSFETFGIPLAFQLDIKTVQYIGFSVTVYADINPDKIYGGVHLAILIGNIPRIWIYEDPSLILK